MQHKLSLKLGDIILIAVIVLTAVVMLVLPFFSNKSEYAEIVIAEKDEVQIVNLNTVATYNIASRGVKLQVCVSGGEVFVKESDCRDGICRNTPPISRLGQSIVCAPAGVVVRIVGEGVGVDGISG